MFFVAGLIVPDFRKIIPPTPSKAKPAIGFKNFCRSKVCLVKVQTPNGIKPNKTTAYSFDKSASKNITHPQKSVVGFLSSRYLKE